MIIKEGERIDELQRNGYRIIQKTNGFCFGMDAVLLSGFASVKPGEKVLDLGTGTGIIPILLEAKTEGSHFTGLEIQAEMAEMASRSVALNRLEEKVSIVQVFFSPEDLNLIKNGPADRRRFIDLELCQLNRLYVHSLVQYNRS